MINKKFLDFPQITVKETLQLSKKDFKNIENNNANDNDIKELKRKIDSIIKYQKPYISKQFYEILKQNSSNAKIIYNFIFSEQNEFNIKEKSTKETKIKRIVNLSRFFDHKKLVSYERKTYSLLSFNVIRVLRLNSLKFTFNFDLVSNFRSEVNLSMISPLESITRFIASVDKLTRIP